MVAFFVDAADLLGVPRSVAAIYGICFASPVSLSFRDIQVRLELSQGSVSQGLRLLRSMGALRITTGTEPRLEYYTPELEMRKLAGRFIEERLEKQLASGKARLARIEQTMPKSTQFESELRDRVRFLSTWHRKGSALIPVMKAFLLLR